MLAFKEEPGTEMCVCLSVCVGVSVSLRSTWMHFVKRFAISIISLISFLLCVF